MYGLISSDSKPKTSRSIHYTDNPFSKLRTPKRGRGAPRRVESQISLQSSEESIDDRKLN
jgi:hypothetical protein